MKEKTELSNGLSRENTPKQRPSDVTRVSLIEGYQ